ncbi:MAG TPA: sulfatase, partial [Chryseolinea sp.]
MSDHHKESFKLPEFDLLNKKWDRRTFLAKTSLGLGALALSSLAGKKLFGQTAGSSPVKNPSENLEEDILRAIPHFAPRAKRVVYLC